MFIKNMKYELMSNDTKVSKNGKTMYRIRALKDFGNVRKGDEGGYIEHTGNLSQYKKCWVAEDSYVYDNAKISGNVQISGGASIFGNVELTKNCSIHGNTEISDILEWEVVRPPKEMAKSSYVPTHSENDTQERVENFKEQEDVPEIPVFLDRSYKISKEENMY